MASTNEDAAILATCRDGGGRSLIMRHLPDRGTIELGWWAEDEGAIQPQGPAFEIAAEALEVNAFVRLCEEALGAEAAEGELARSGPVADGAELFALGSRDEVTLVRRPERDDAIRLPRAMLKPLIVEMLPTAIARLSRLGLGLPQQAD